MLAEQDGDYVLHCLYSDARHQTSQRTVSGLCVLFERITGKWKFSDRHLVL